MFIFLLSFILGCITLLTVRDWVLGKIHARTRKKQLLLIAQLISLQQWEKAEKELRSLFNRGRAEKEIYLLEIQILKGKGLLQEALNATEMKSRLFPEDLLFRLEEGKILLELNRAQEALTAFKICAPIMRQESDLIALATVLCRAGYPQECLDILSPFLQRVNNGKIAVLAGDAFYALKNFPEAIIYYTKGLETGYRTHHTHLQLAHTYRRLGTLARAEHIFYELLTKDPHDIEATLGLGACIQERGQHHRALLLYQTALFNTRDQRLLHQAAMAALWSTKYCEAEVYFFELLESQPEDIHYHTYYALSLEKQKKWQEAEQAYLKMIHLFPQDPCGFRALAWMFGVGVSQTLKPEGAMHYAYISLKLKNDPLAWEILSACTARMGLFEKAYQIQISLSKQDKDPQSKARRQQLLRNLRMRTPLADCHILRTAVA